LSPILVRPVREQLEHDRVIRLLQAKYKRKYDVGINPGAEQGAPVGTGTSAVFPDLVLQSTERSRKLMGVIEVETSESINHLEAMSQWASLGRLRVPFYLYVPAGSLDPTRRLCADHQIPVSELWTYAFIGDQPRFTQITRSAATPQTKTAADRPTAPVERRTVSPAARKKPAAKPRPRVAAKSAPRSRSIASKAKKTAKPLRAQKRK
jgi:hypothetical protein